jgi:hypothetical protein
MKLVMLIAHHYHKTSGLQDCPTFELDNAKCKSSCLLEIQQKLRIRIFVNCLLELLTSVLYKFIYTYCWELMKSVGSHGSLSLPFMMKVMVCHFVSDSHEVMTALIVVLPLIVVVEIALQLHRSLSTPTIGS